MSTTGLLPTYLCALIIFIPIVIGGIYATKAKIRFVTFTNQLRKDGKYVEWANENKILLFLENFSLYAFLTSFFGFMIAGLLNQENVARFLLVCFIIGTLLAIALSFILYRKVPNE